MLLKNATKMCVNSWLQLFLLPFLFELKLQHLGKSVKFTYTVVFILNFDLNIEKLTLKLLVFFLSFLGTIIIWNNT